MIFVLFVVFVILTAIDGLKISPVSLTDISKKDAIKKVGLFSTVIVSSIISKPPSVKAAVVASKTLNPKSLSASDDFLSGFVGGAVSRSVKEIVLHPIDTIRAREQIPNFISTASNDSSIIKDLYKGITPALLGGIPAGAVFFGVKDYTKNILRNAKFSKTSATILSVVAANIPYWIIRTPSEVLKTRKQVDLNSTHQWLLYDSFGSNVAYALPADVIKFIAYEYLKDILSLDKGDGKISGLDAAIVGSLSGLVAQISTTPLDVARTRIMTSSSSLDSKNPIDVMINIAKNESISALAAGTRPRALRALVSGGIQFASYELSKNVLSPK